MVHQEYQNLLLIAKAVFGKEEDAKPPTSAQEAKDQIDRLLGKKK